MHPWRTTKREPRGALPGDFFCAKLPIDKTKKMWYNWPALFARAGRNFNYTTLSAICQEKNAKKNNLIIFPKSVDKSVRLCYNKYVIKGQELQQKGTVNYEKV